MICRFVCLAFLLPVLMGASNVFAQEGPVGDTALGQFAHLPNGGRPEVKVPFPEVHDWDKLKITLSRTSCWGDCRGYSVEIDGDGTVHYDGKNFVAITGIHTGKVSVEAVKALVLAFRKAEFYWLFDEYRAPSTDVQTYSVEITFDGTGKKVEDYEGQMVGMPPDVRDLEEQIDKVAETEKWVNGNAETIASLKAENWDFHSTNDSNLRLLESAAIVNNSDLVRALLEAGVSAKGVSGCVALSGALERHNEQSVHALVAAGAPMHVAVKRGQENYICDTLLSAARTGNPEAIQLALNQHPDINWQDSLGRTAFFCAAQSWTMGGMQGDFPSVLKLLLAAGADPSIPSNLGLTPLAYAMRFGIGTNRATEIADIIGNQQPPVGTPDR